MRWRDKCALTLAHHWLRTGAQISELLLGTRQLLLQCCLLPFLPGLRELTQPLFGEGDGRAVTRAAAVEHDAQDALAEAITDLTAESGSLVEALDDLGDPGAYSATGYARMRALAGELRRLRAHVGRPLADLAAEAERVLGLDIEVAGVMNGDRFVI